MCAARHVRSTSTGKAEEKARAEHSVCGIDRDNGRANNSLSIKEIKAFIRSMLPGNFCFEDHPPRIKSGAGSLFPSGPTGVQSPLGLLCSLNHICFFEIVRPGNEPVRIGGFVVKVGWK